MTQKWKVIIIRAQERRNDINTATNAPCKALQVKAQWILTDSKLASLLPMCLIIHPVTTLDTACNVIDAACKFKIIMQILGIMQYVCGTRVCSLTN